MTTHQPMLWEPTPKQQAELPPEQRPQAENRWRKGLPPTNAGRPLTIDDVLSSGSLGAHIISVDTSGG